MSRTAPRKDDRDTELVDRLVHINRVAKVVKGGRRFGFAALVVVGDMKGRVGFGHGKAREVPEAVRKAGDEAKRRLQRVPLREGRTLHHDIAGRHGAGKVILRAAPPGTGIIAGGPLRAVFEALGMQDVVAKSVGSSNPYNMVRAVFAALDQQASPRLIAARRGKKAPELIARRQPMPGDKDVGEAAKDAPKPDAKPQAKRGAAGDKARKGKPDKSDKSEKSGKSGKSNRGRDDKAKRTDADKPPAKPLVVERKGAAKSASRSSASETAKDAGTDSDKDAGKKDESKDAKDGS